MDDKTKIKRVMEILKTKYTNLNAVDCFTMAADIVDVCRDEATFSYTHSYGSFKVSGGGVDIEILRRIFNEMK